MNERSAGFVVHEHAWVSGGKTGNFRHSHVGGNEPHRHEHTGPACFDRTSRKPTKRPTGERLEAIPIPREERLFEVYITDSARFNREPLPYGPLGIGMVEARLMGGFGLIPVYHDLRNVPSASTRERTGGGRECVPTQPTEAPARIPQGGARRRGTPRGGIVTSKELREWHEREAKRTVGVVLDGRDITGPLIAFHRSAAEALASLEAERDAMRDAMVALFPADEGFTEAFDDLRDRGLLVEVPSDERFRADWGEECATMYVWAWSPLARALSEEPRETLRSEEQRT